MQYTRAGIVSDGLDIFLCFPRAHKSNDYNQTITVSQGPLFKSDRKYIEAPKALKDSSVAVTKGQ